MDFDLTKENIQPLRGGRNPQQLVMALQAQTNQEYQMQLQQQRQEFETAIRNYQGNDPLEAFYNYICWVEQSYPKHGHEGNLIELLEHCLRLFENDSRYINDRRFCKLWIKYFDHLPNPLELYHMLYAKGLCKGCTDFYKAWAYYYEAAEDFQNAHNVFEEGKRNLAQPHDELLAAQKNLVLATGEHILYGRDEEKLAEKRQALTSLITYRPGRVGSVRVASANGSVVLPNNQGMQQRGVNIPVPVFEDRGRFEVTGAEAVPPVSIIDVVKRQDASKENTLKPGMWTTVPVKKRVLAQKPASVIKVYEEPETPNFPAETQERYLDWVVSIRYPEENALPNGVPMYPKDRVYSDPSTEYSIEELRAMRYHRGRKVMADAAGAAESILVDDDDDDYVVLDDMAPAPQVPDQIFQDPPCQSPANPNISIPKETNSSQLFGHVGVVYQGNTTCFNNTQSMPQLPSAIPSDSLSRSIAGNCSGIGPTIPTITRQSMVATPARPVVPFSIFIEDDDDDDEVVNPWSPVMQTKEKKPAFAVFEHTMQEMPLSVQPKGSAMKTAFRTLTADDLAETGSRGGMDGAAAAQPTDGARPMPLFSDNSSSSFEDVCDFAQDLNTQQFNLNLKDMQVSTPQAKRPVPGLSSNEAEVQNTRKQLFLDSKVQRDQQVLSTIFEESKGSVSSSSSSGATTKSSLFSSGNHTAKMSTISEEHNSYLAQNLMANAALRASLLGDIMDFRPEPTVAASAAPTLRDESVLMQASPIVSPVRKIPAPAIVKPLDTCPSDPFKPHVINQLLERVKFPGPHSQGYILLNNTPRLIVTKKDPMFIGNEGYLIEKQLGKGTFGTVYKAINYITNQQVALKFQRPSNKWEFYICREIQARLADHPLRNRFMDVSTAYFSDQASILVSEYMPFGSLLDAANAYKIKSGAKMKEMTCIYFTLEMMEIIKVMHDIKIIHADIKPDNFLVFLGADGLLHLQLIDFGCSIDMTLYPPNALFRRVVTTEDFVCCEMRDGRPWSYHTDLFCIAATAHVLIFDKYIQLRQTDGLWSVTNRVPRYMKVDLWNMFFSNLLNQQTGPADLATLLFLFREEMERMKKDVPGEIRYMTNVLSNR